MATRQKHHKMQRLALTLSTMVLAAIAGPASAVALTGVGTSKPAGQTTHPKQKRCRAHYVKKSKTVKKSKQSGDRSANPFVFVYNYLKQVVAEMRKVIWPNRKQMFSYTSVVLAFLAFMVALVGLADFGLTKLVLLVFG